MSEFPQLVRKGLSPRLCFRDDASVAATIKPDCQSQNDRSDDHTENPDVFAEMIMMRQPGIFMQR